LKKGEKSMETMIINQQSKINYGKELQQVIVNVCNAVSKIIRLPKDSEVSIMIVDNLSLIHI